MNSGELLVSADTLIRIFLFLLYAPVVLISYWKLMPRLSPTSRRLASAMLAAQVLVIAVALDSREASPSYSKWLWHLDLEWNISSALASTQLALVGGLALMTAWLAKARPVWQRLYLGAIGLVFLYLAWDEYFHVHEDIHNWKRYYAAGGMLVAAATAIVAARSPRRAWIWHLYLLTGLAVSAAGAIGIELMPRRVCGALEFLSLDRCLYFYWFEEPLEFLGIWVILIAVLGQVSDTGPPPRIRRLLYTLPALWIFLLFLYSLVPRLELQHLAQPAAVQFKSGAHLHGYHIDSGEEAAHIRLYTSARQRDYLAVGYSVHLVDQVSGESVASLDRWARYQHSFWLFGPDYMPIYRHRMEVKIPPQAPTNRALWIVLTFWRRENRERVYQEVLASDHELLDETQVILGELTIGDA